MDEKRFEEILVKNLGETEKKMEKMMDEKYNSLEQKIIDNGFYFEHTYGEKISAIFDKLQLNDDLKQIQDTENKQIQKQ